MAIAEAHHLKTSIASRSLVLDPYQHVDAVKQFRDAFKLVRKPPKDSLLQEILRGMAEIPYENLSKIITLKGSENWQSPAIRLPEHVMAEHLEYRLGGTCFSLTFLLQSVLVQSGFACYPVMADMRRGRNVHCCLVVVLGATKLLVDPGYLLMQPMALSQVTCKLYRTEFTGVELRYESEKQTYDLFTFNRRGSRWRYRFRDLPAAPDEFLNHWLASFHKNSMHGLCLTKVQREGLLFINRHFMRETTFAGKRNFNIKRNYHASIYEHFGIAPQLVEQAQIALASNLQKKRDLGLWLPKRPQPGAETEP